jgi:RNA polymerase sigma factor (sigma-70 family)
MSQTTEQNDRARNYHIINDYAREQVAYHTTRAAKWLGLRKMDREDFAQDLLLALCKAAPDFDPAVASGNTFVQHVLRLAALHQMRTLQRTRRCVVRSAAKMTDCDDSAIELVNCPRSLDHARHDLRTDVALALRRMPRRTRAVARLLMTSSQSQAARELGTSRQAVNEHVRSLRTGPSGALLRSAC